MTNNIEDTHPATRIVVSRSLSYCSQITATRTIEAIEIPAMLKMRKILDSHIIRNIIIRERPKWVGISK